MGGDQMFARKGKLASADCEHLSTVIVRNSGIERTVCEACGNVSFRGIEGLSGTVDRSRFERDIERSRLPVASG
jgi:hypothetical protein